MSHCCVYPVGYFTFESCYVSIGDQFYLDRRAIGSDNRYLLLLQAALSQEFVSGRGEDLLNAAAAAAGRQVALRLGVKRLGTKNPDEVLNHLMSFADFFFLLPWRRQMFAT